MSAAKELAKRQGLITAAIVIVALLALGLVLFLIVPILKDVRKLAGGAGDLGAGAGQLASGAGATIGAVGNVGQALGDAVRPRKNDPNRVRPGEISSGKPDLKLELVDSKSSLAGYGSWWVTGGRDKKNYAKLRVTANGRPVHGATVSASYVHSIAQSQLKNHQPDATLRDGTTEHRWTVPNIGGIDTEDDVRFRARHPNYNPSNEVYVR